MAKIVRRFQRLLARNLPIFSLKLALNEEAIKCESISAQSIVFSFVYVKVYSGLY